VTDIAVEREYGFGAAARILGLPEAKLRYWSQSGFVGPSLRRGVRQVFTFQDLVSARAAKELVDRGFQPAHIRKALDQVRTKLPSVHRPLEKLRVAWDGNVLAVVEDGVTFEVSGQRRFDFGLSELAARAAEVLDLAEARSVDAKPKEATNPVASQSAYEWFAQGLAEEGSPGQEAQAEECYRKALASDPGLAAAHTNLGSLAYRRADLAGARIEFQAALDLDPEQPEARYNLAGIQYQQGEIEQAASELRRVLQHTPWFADAHYNLATALEKLGSKRQAAEHLHRYIDLEAHKPEPNSPWLEEAHVRLLRLEPHGDE
jgi:tetratricopeptide (TPR) repeat protein